MVWAQLLDSLRGFFQDSHLPTVLSLGFLLEGVPWKMSYSMTLWLASGWKGPAQPQPHPSTFPKGRDPSENLLSPWKACTSSSCFFWD